MQFGSQLGLSLYDRSKAWKNTKKDRTPVSTQNLTVVAKDAILKADTRVRLDKCAESLEVRYANRQIPQNDYNDLCDLIKTRKEVIKT
jgi:hypothetical protein